MGNEKEINTEAQVERAYIYIYIYIHMNRKNGYILSLHVNNIVTKQTDGQRRFANC